MRNINRMNDYFVRYLLGSVGHEDVLENIVNCVLRDSGFQEVHNLEIINPHNLPENIHVQFLSTVKNRDVLRHNPQKRLPNSAQRE